MERGVRDYLVTQLFLGEIEVLKRAFIHKRTSSFIEAGGHTARGQNAALLALHLGPLPKHSHVSKIDAPE